MKRAAKPTTPDRELFAAYKKFAVVEARMKAADTRAAKAGSLGKSTKAQKRAFAKWERLVSRAHYAARDWVVWPAVTIDGMLLKIQVAKSEGLITAPMLGALECDLERLRDGTPDAKLIRLCDEAAHLAKIFNARAVKSGNLRGGRRDASSRRTAAAERAFNVAQRRAFAIPATLSLCGVTQDRDARRSVIRP